MESQKNKIVYFIRHGETEQNIQGAPSKVDA